MRLQPGILITIAFAGCGSDAPEPPTIAPGVVVTYPRDNQRDVPLGSRLIISFSDPTAADEIAGCSVVGPNGNLDIAVSVIGNNKTLAIVANGFEPGATYEVHVDASATQPLFRFTTRSDRPRSGPPSVIAINGSAPDAPGEFRPIFETSTIQLVFSEPLDPRSVAFEPGAVELVDAVGASVPATLISRGIHVVLDPAAPLAAGETYEVRLGDRLSDLGGERLAATSIEFTPVASIGSGSIRQTLRTREQGDPDAAIQRTDAGNVMDVAHPLIGNISASVKPSAIAAELGDPTAIGGPIAFTIPKGQHFAASPLDIELAGAVPSGLATGDIQIELLADGGGRIYRNTNQPADTVPDNDRAPLLVDLSLDLGVYASDPTGNAVLAQTVLGAQLTGLAIADEGALAIETFGSLDIALLGITDAPANLVLDLISDPTAAVAADAQAPSLSASLPAAGTHELGADDGIELVFDEPIDLDRARAGGVVLHDADGSVIPSTVELHGSVAVLRPRAMLPDGHDYRVDLNDVADLAGNVMPPRSVALGTPLVGGTDVPVTVEAIYPGAPCALVDASPTSAGRCAGGKTSDDGYRRFGLPAEERIAVVFDQPVRAESVTLGGACDTGSVRVERVDDGGTCLGVVAGTLLRHRRDIAFVPDHPWAPREHYRLRLVSGPDATCNPGELCGANGRAASFEPLRGTGTSGGPDLGVDFVGAAAAGHTTLVASTSPYADINGSGNLDSGEVLPDTNRVALRIAGTSGLITSASFSGGDCLPETPDVEACMYVVGAIPAQLGDARTDCVLPDGTTAASCVPVTMTPQAMYSTSVSMTAAALGIGITTSTGMSVMRMRDPATAPLEGYIVDRGGGPTLVAALDLYMDAPDMSLPLSQHDMHSKPLSVLLEGPVSFRADGRLSLALHNVAEVPISVGINAPFGISGTVNLVVPEGEMRLQLLTRPQRGSVP